MSTPATPRSIKRIANRLTIAAIATALICLGAQQLLNQSNQMARALVAVANSPMPTRYKAYLTPLDRDVLNGVARDKDQTNNSLDLTISGKGFFHVKIAPQLSDGTAYTRNGHLGIDSNRDLILMVGAGYRLIPPINIPPRATHIAIANDGTVQCQMPDLRVCTCGQIQLSTFDHQRNLMPLGSGFFADNQATGPAIISSPGNNGTGVLMQGFLETDNARESIASLK